MALKVPSPIPGSTVARVTSVDGICNDIDHVRPDFLFFFYQCKGKPRRALS